MLMAIRRQHCAACHTDSNFPLSVGEASYQSIPGHPRWGLAPIEMAWEGKTLGEICRQIKDPTRNGGLNSSPRRVSEQPTSFGIGAMPACPVAHWLTSQTSSIQSAE
jgi:hypothetical protein